MKAEVTTIALSTAYLCPEGHITSSSVRCSCGCGNLYSLAVILDRELKSAPIVQQLEEIPGLLEDLPTLQRITKLYTA